MKIIFYYSNGQTYTAKGVKDYLILDDYLMYWETSIIDNFIKSTKNYHIPLDDLVGIKVHYSENEVVLQRFKSKCSLVGGFVL